MERSEEKTDDRSSEQEEGSAANGRGEDERGEGKGTEDQRGDGKDQGDEGSPGPAEPTEEEKERQREEDARAAQERLEEVMDAPPEEHGALKADAVGSTIILIGALFVIFGVIVALAFSPWGWLGAAIGVVEIVVGQMIRSGAHRRNRAE